MPVFTLTGASGGGKSTIIAALKNRGFNTQPEIGRALVREQIKQNGTALPWQDMTAFRTLLFNRSVEMFDKLQNERGVYFFDRSFTDAIASFRTTDEVVPPRYFTAAKIRQLANPILICAPWTEIFKQDAERKHDFEYVLADYHANIATYKDFGYDLVEIPQLPVEQRVDFILSIQAIKQALTDTQ